MSRWWAGPRAGIARLGVGRTFQTPKLLTELSATENAMLGAFAAERASTVEVALWAPRARREQAALAALAQHFLGFVGLGERVHEQAGELPHGQQRLAEIARALIGRPRLLLLDEPAAGLSMTELDRLGALIRSIADLGVTVVIVEHHLGTGRRYLPPRHGARPGQRARGGRAGRRVRRPRP